MNCQTRFPNQKVVFYHIDSDMIESDFKHKQRKYTSTTTLSSFLKTKDILVLVNNSTPIGWTEAKLISSYIDAGYGYIVGKQNLYNPW